MGLFFIGMAIWPSDEGVEGSCQVTNLAGVTYQCVGGRGKSFKLNMANVTFEDGSTRLCRTFWLTDKCGLVGSDRPTEVFEGEKRPCLWFESELDLQTFGSAPAGACFEPGHVESLKSLPILLWGIAAGLLSCCFCCCLYLDCKGDNEDAKCANEDATAHDAKADLKNATAAVADTDTLAVASCA